MSVGCALVSFRKRISVHHTILTRSCTVERTWATERERETERERHIEKSYGYRR